MTLASLTDFTPIASDSGDTIGYYSLSDPGPDGKRYFTQIFVEPESRHQGVGSTVYKTVGEELARHGEQLISDPDGFSSGALAVWQSLEQGEYATRHGQPRVDELGDVYGASFAYQHKTE